MTGKRRPKAGQIVAIPTGDGRYVAGKLLFLSKRYRNVALIGLSPREVRVDDPAPGLLEVDLEMLLYGSKAAVASGRWPILGSSPLSDWERAQSLRRVAGGVWLADDYVREATPADLEELPEMRVKGDLLVEKAAQAVLDGAEAPQ